MKAFGLGTALLCVASLFATGVDAAAQRTTQRMPTGIDVDLYVLSLDQQPVEHADLVIRRADGSWIQPTEANGGHYLFKNAATRSERKISVQYRDKMDGPSIVDVRLDDAPLVRLIVSLDAPSAVVKEARQKAIGSFTARPNTATTGGTPDPAPANDSCARAQPIVVGTTPFTTRGASTDGPDTLLYGAILRDVWYSFVAPETGILTASTCGAPFDTVLAVYAGTGCGQAQGSELAANDDGLGCGLASVVNSPVVRGNSYLIRVGGLTATSVGAGDLALSITPTATNDNCAGALTISSNATVTFNSDFATTGGDPQFNCTSGGPGAGHGTLWYRFVATATSAIVDTNQSRGATDTVISVYDQCGSEASIACSDDPVTGRLSSVVLQGLTVGNTYWVQVGSYSQLSAGDITLDVSSPATTTGIGVSNDECEGAEVIGALPFITTFSNVGATDDIASPCGVFSGPFKNVWFQVVGTGNTMTATTCNAGTRVSDTKLSVFCGTCDSLTCVGGNDDNCVGFSLLNSTFSWCSQAGAIYYITVGNFSATTIPGDIQLKVTDDGVPCSATVQCIPEGACCFLDGTCLKLTEAECATMGGAYQGDGTGCVLESVADGGFEGGPFGGFWTEASTNFGTPICDGSCGFGGGTGPHTGMFWCWFGGIAAPEDGSVEQSVVISSVSSTMLFYLEIPAASGNGTDFMRVLIDGNNEFEVLESDMGDYFPYKPVLVDVSAYADDLPHTLRFESSISGSAISSFFVDDVSIEAQVSPCCVILDFETEDDFTTPLVNGQDIDAGENGNLVNINGLSFNGLKAAIFDSNPRGPNATSQDPDLLVNLGNILIVQEQPGQRVAGIYDRPNDDARGGDITVDFLNGPVFMKMIDIIDIDQPAPTQDVIVTLIDGEGDTRVYTVPSGWTTDITVSGGTGFNTLNLDTLAPQPGFSTSATAVQDADFDARGVVQMTIHLNGSGAIDNIVYAR